MKAIHESAASGRAEVGYTQLERELAPLLARLTAEELQRAFERARAEPLSAFEEEYEKAVAILHALPK